MNIKHENGIVTFLMRTGKDLVRSTMTIGSAMGIVNKSKNVVEQLGLTPDVAQIIVDDTYFFPAIPEPKRKKQTEETKDE